MPDANAMQTMKLLQPWNGHVPGEVAGFTAETARKLFDHEVARYVDFVPGEGGKPGRYADSKMNVTGLGGGMLHKMKAIVDGVFGTDDGGAPTLIPNPQGFGPVTAGAMFSNAPGTAPPVPLPDGPPEAGTNWAPPLAGDTDPEAAARPDELIGRKKK